MKKRLLATVMVGAAVAVLFVGSAAHGEKSVGIAWCYSPCGTDPATGKCCPYYNDPSGALVCCACPPDPLSPCDGIGLFAGGPAGIPLCLAGYWNIASNASGVLPNLDEDVNGTRVPTSATVVWEATGSNFSKSGVGFRDDSTTGFNQTLMSSYLDQNTDIFFPFFIQIDGLPSDLAAGYDVVIYTLVTVPGFGGEYTVNGIGPAFVLAGGGGAYGPDFVEAMPANDPDFGVRDWGNYVVFRGLSGSTVTITVSHGAKGHSPVNAVQIISRP